MNQHLQSIIDFIQQNENISAEEKEALIKATKKVKTDLEISEFKLERTEKVKRTTAILLEETIEELEQKRKSVEQQNRELEIESALERVRTVAMGMNKTDDLLNICETLFRELQLLGFSQLRNAIIQTFDDEKKYFNDYDFSDVTGGWISRIPYTGHPIIEKFIQNIRKNNDAFVETVVAGKEMEEWKKFREDNGEVADPRLDNIQELFYYHYSVGEGDIGISTFSAISAEKQNLLKRFRNVFDLAYRRYIDITKAEAQARESEIQLAMERIRARTMAMQKSEELAGASKLMFEQLKQLGIHTYSSGFNIWDQEKNELVSWLCNPDGSLNPPFRTPINGDPWHFSQFKSWRKGEDFIVKDLAGEEMQAHFRYLRTFPLLDEAFANAIAAGHQMPERQIHHAANFSQGNLLFITLEPCPESHEIFKRFAKVFEQTYTRFLDLQKAEAQAHEAQIETSLERVRSRTMSMQKSEELPETAAVLFKQLVLLGIQPNRLYIGIIKAKSGLIEFWATDEEGNKVSAQFIGDANRNASMKKMYDAWKAEKKSLTIDMQGKELSNYFEYMVDELKVPFTKGLSQKRRIQTIAIFGKGFLGIASPDEQPEATTQLLVRFAAVFNLTYTRFNDLKVAEAHAIQAEEDLIKLQTEKQRAEDALNELQATQTQLVQSEKMASLGELTAGIAHEIQNPLNFVNNFSEVSKELLDEMNEEIEKGNFDDVKDIAADVIQNLEKINHHGKRADAIVKGMLQHSRSSTGQKELTDINALTDEYLRLAFHGLRAKDKTFNAALKTDFDESIGLIKIMPQDMGRVILNLITNAFYAVTERNKLKLQGYEPVVSISTKRNGNTIQIQVTDNGNGIPQNIVDKIFQPFFTTKPTGQGTGLGLSLAYDIVKAHGGELIVETEVGDPGFSGKIKGSTFIIQLPL